MRLIFGGLAVSIMVLAVAWGLSPRGSPPSPSHRLFLAGDSELWVVDTDTQRVRHISVVPELSPGDPPYRILRRGDRLVLWGGATYVRNPDLRAPATSLADDAGFFIPSAHDDRVWLGIFDPMSNSVVAAVREMTVTGKVTVPDVKPPGGHWPDGAVSDGLLFSLGGGRVEVWDPVSRRILRRLPIADPGPSFGNLVASCGFQCRTLRLTDVHAGNSKVVGLPKGFAEFGVYSGAFSPDGSLFALPVQSTPSFTHPELGIDLAIVDVSRGATRIVKSSHVPTGYNLVAWSSLGDTAFFTGGDRFKKRVVLSYRMGEPRASVLYAGLGDFYGIAAT